MSRNTIVPSTRVDLVTFYLLSHLIIVCLAVGGGLFATGSEATKGLICIGAALLGMFALGGHMLMVDESRKEAWRQIAREKESNARRLADLVGNMWERTKENERLKGEVFELQNMLTPTPSRVQISAPSPRSGRPLLDWGSDRDKIPSIVPLPVLGSDDVTKTDPGHTPTWTH